MKNIQVTFTSLILALALSASAASPVTESYVGSETPDPLCPFPAEDQIIYFPYPGDCSKYYECFNGVKTEYQCSDGLWWHQQISNCDYPGSYCTEDTTTEYPSSPTTSPTYYSTATIPESTIESTTPEITTWITETTWTTEIWSTSTPSPPETTTSDNVDPRCVNNETSYWPHPEFCSRYIECYKGDSYEMMCPPGLYFSDKHKECVNAEDSECCSYNNSCA